MGAKHVKETPSEQDEKRAQGCYLLLLSHLEQTIRGPEIHERTETFNNICMGQY
jgi:hypothetical protein